MRSRLARIDARRGSSFVSAALAIGLAVAGLVPELEKRAVWKREEAREAELEGDLAGK